MLMEAGLEWECCWTSEDTEPAGCPYIAGDEKELYASLKRRFVEKCLECPRFKNDLMKLQETGHPVAAPLQYLITYFLDQKEQLHYMASFLNSRNREMQFLHEIGVVLQTSMELDEVLSVAMTAITAGKGFGMNRAFLLLTDKERHMLKGYLGVGPRSYQEAWQIWEDIGRNDFSLKEMAKNFYDTKLSSEKVKFQDILEKLVIPLNNLDNILNKTLFEGKPMLVEDAFHNDDIDPELARTLGVDTFFVLPLVSRNRRIGVIIADNFITHKPITVPDMESMETLAFPVAFAIERASLYERLQEDLVKLTEANNKLKEQQQLIVKMEKMALVGKITSSIAHSIRNPLMIIGGFARSLQRNLAPEDPKREYIDSIVQESKHLEDALEEVLGYASSLYPAMDMWDINQLVGNICREFQDKLEKTGITCSLDFGPDLPMVFIDYKQIAYCIRKIIGNTIEAMPEGGEIRIKTRLETDCIVLELLDTSKIVTQATNDFIVTPAFTTQEQINALGISLCKMILEKHSQSFRVEKSPEGGMKYTIRLSLQKEEIARE
jgi:signal transduction histidine kinase